MSRLSGHALRLTQLAEAYLAAGRIEEALGTGDQALELSLNHQEEAYRAWALRLIAEARAAQAGGEAQAAATAAFHESLALAASLGMRPLMSHCHIGLSKVYRRTGQEEAAREHYATGMGLYRAMNMRLWIERAEALAKASAL